MSYSTTTLLLVLAYVSFSTSAAAISTATLVETPPINNTLYIISNAERPSLRLPGLTPVGFKRSRNCLPNVLAPLDIGLIVSCPYDARTGLCAETVETIGPTAKKLGVEVNATCVAGQDADDDCLYNLISGFGKKSTKAVLIVWDILDFDGLFESLDIDDSTPEADDSDDDTPHFDLLSKVVQNEVTSVVSQGCAGLDGQAPGSFRRSLRAARGYSKKIQKKERILSRVVGKSGQV
uniref:Uncharacterized protein n=1 Tax=Psilocybe cubensis TaxID=181762 RepID=A0A8H7XSI9_PSICU